MNLLTLDYLHVSHQMYASRSFAAILGSQLGGWELRGFHKGCLSQKQQRKWGSPSKTPPLSSGSAFSQQSLGNAATFAYPTEGGLGLILSPYKSCCFQVLSFGVAGGEEQNRKKIAFIKLMLVSAPGKENGEEKWGAFELNGLLWRFVSGAGGWGWDRGKAGSLPPWVPSVCVQ